MKILFLLLVCLTVSVKFSHAKSSTSQNATTSGPSKNETHPKSSKNDTVSKSTTKNVPISKLSKNETYKNETNKNETDMFSVETVANETVNEINSLRAGVAFAPPVNDGKCSQSEIDEMKKNNTFLAKRFDDKKLGQICKRARNWNDVVVRQRAIERSRSGGGGLGAPGPVACTPGEPCAVLVNAPERPQFTEAQSSFINEVRMCKGLQCFEGKNETTEEEGIVDISLPETRSGGGVVGAPGKGPPTTKKPKKRSWSKVTRKEYRTLTDDERNAFHAALNSLKKTKIDGISKYDLLVEYHAPKTSPAAHFGCAFLPWHREFLKQLEVAMRYENSNVFLPYWDSTLDKGLPTPCDSIFFSDSFVGAGRDHLTGPFGHWKTARSFDGSNDLSLKRECGEDGDLFEPEDVDYILTKDNLKDFCYCNDRVLESSHGMIHMFVGGYMSQIPLAPNDPIFFMHHCFIDYIWEQWRQKKQNRTQREKDYPPDASACGVEYDGDAPMKPFNGVIIKDGLSNSYTDELYVYAPRPSCPYNCYGPYLFCSSKFKPPRCLSKIKLGGNCKDYEGEDVCDNGKCVYGKCKEV